jgi:hypothetical protein
METGNGIVIWFDQSKNKYGLQNTHYVEGPSGASDSALTSLGSPSFYDDPNEIVELLESLKSSSRQAQPA